MYKYLHVFLDGHAAYIISYHSFQRELYVYTLLWCGLYEVFGKIITITPTYKLLVSYTCFTVIFVGPLVLCPVVYSNDALLATYFLLGLHFNHEDGTMVGFHQITWFNTPRRQNSSFMQNDKCFVTTDYPLKHKICCHDASLKNDVTVTRVS
jgi:hypothetical protein